MTLVDLTVNQLKRAATIKEQIDRLNKELGAILGVASKTSTVPRKKFTMSAAVKKKIAAAQKARWAKLRRAKSEAMRSDKATKAVVKRRRMPQRMRGAPPS
jgi:hypothetical protein